MFLLGFYFGLARGRVSGQMPRNLTKSITAGRAKNRQSLRAVDIINRLAEHNQAASRFLTGAVEKEDPVWLKRCSSEDEKGYYAELIEIATLLQNDAPETMMFAEFRKEYMQQLATFGSRYARMVVITQDSFAVGARLTTLKKYPVSEIILIPGMTDSLDGTITLSDYILPLMINVIVAAMSYGGVNETPDT